VETMGLEPTTPCLQMTISHIPDQRRNRELSGQSRFPLSATIRP
jgi:hypothetical protein